MSKNWINAGKAIPFVGAATVGKLTVVGDALIGVADRTSSATEDNQLHMCGHWELDKGNFALNVGDLYLVDAAMASVETGAVGVIAAGVVTRSADASATTVDVVLYEGHKPEVTA